MLNVFHDCHARGNTFPAELGSDSRLRLYVELTKPRVAALITFTALVGMFLATPGIPPWTVLVCGTLGIALSCACAAALNQIFERRTDARMSRTRARLRGTAPKSRAFEATSYALDAPGRRAACASKVAVERQPSWRL
jgi:heme O synthase-like polyprenyltransferase